VLFVTWIMGGNWAEGVGGNLASLPDIGYSSINIEEGNHM
jgi:hypothetical protein